MASSSSTDTPASLSTSLTSEQGRLEDASHATYRDGQLVWDGGKLGDQDIITITSIEDRENGQRIWSLAPVDPASDPKQPPFELQTTPATSLPQDFVERHIFRALPDHLDPATHSIYVLVSTRSGTGLALEFFNDILRPLLRAIGLADSGYSVIQTENAESVKTFARGVLIGGANQGKKQTVVLLSGDGGIVDILNGLQETRNQPRYFYSILILFYLLKLNRSTYVKPIVTLIPLGTGNALFHSLHRGSAIPSMYVQGLRTLLGGEPRTLPVYRATFSPGARSLSDEGQTATPLPTGGLYGAVVASYGLHATLVADSDTTEYRKHGDKRFSLVAKDLMFPEDGSAPHAYKADVTLFKSGGKKEVLERKEHGYLLATPLSNMERTFMISPSSKPLDGQLRMVHFGTVSGEKAMQIMMEAYNAGNHVNMDEVSYESIDGMRIDVREEGGDWKWRRFCVDGLTVAVEENGWMEVQRLREGGEAVDVLVDL